MIKIIPPRAWADFDGPSLEIVKVASGGLRGVDFAAFVKRASHPQASWVRNNPPLPGEVYVHNVAIGSTERHGPNRNSDGYTNKMLERDCPTFEKFARFYLNHKNNDPSRSYGVIKNAYFNTPIERIETISALNGDKKAADRNKGLIAERTLHKLANNVDVAVSQSVRVPHDLCIGCGNKARHRGEYCTAQTCKYGGCRDNLGRVFEDGTHLYVDNPSGTFFDLSDVSDTRGADRTAFITGKVATSDRIVGGAELAEQLGLTAPDHLLDRDTTAALSCLRKLASCPRNKTETAPTWDDCVRIRDHHGYVKAASIPFPSDDNERRYVVEELAAAGVILPPARWLSYVTGVDHVKCAALFAGGIDPQKDLLSRPDVHEVLCDTPAVKSDNRLSAMKKWAYLIPTPAAHAIESALGVISSGTETRQAVKAASVDAPASVVAEAKSRYLAYQGRALVAHQGTDNSLLLMQECLRHNNGTTI